MKRKENGQWAFVDRTGDRFVNNQGSWFTIVKYEGCHDITVKFDTGYVTKATIGRINSRRVKDYLFPSVVGIGCYGVGIFDSNDNGVGRDAHIAWSSMLKRCYGTTERVKMTAYNDCSVCNEWHNYQAFASWYVRQIKEYGWALDKDVIIKNNKEYSPEACCFLPIELNSLLTDRRNHRGNCSQGVYAKNGKFIAQINIDSQNTYLGQFDTDAEAYRVYKAAKEDNVKRVANKFKGRIDDRAYNSLMDYRL